jgi:hypothetical membrane protein
MKSYRPAIIYILIFIVIAHIVVGEQYVWYRHSISQLAGQEYAQAWIMRAGFLGFGVLVQIAGIGRIRAAGRYWYRELPIMIYGLSILASGIFSAAPFIEGVAYSEWEAQLHTLFATAGGWALTAGILLYMLTDRLNSRRTVHAVALILTMGVAFSFFSLPTVSGALQYLLWLVGFSWLAYLGSGTTLSQVGRGALETR